MLRPSYLRPVCRACGRPRFGASALQRMLHDIVARDPPPDQIVDMHPDGTMRWLDVDGRQHVIQVDADEPRELTPAELAAIELE